MSLCPPSSARLRATLGPTLIFRFNYIKVYQDVFNTLYTTVSAVQDKLYIVLISLSPTPEMNCRFKIWHFTNL